MVQMNGTKKIAAYAVRLEQQGELKLDHGVKRELVCAVKDLHADKKLKRQAEEIAASYEKNVASREKKKKSLKKARRLALQQARFSEKAKHNQTVPEVSKEERPLSWYEGPKSSSKRTKLVESVDEIPINLRGPVSKKSKKKRTKKSEKASQMSSNGHPNLDREQQNLSQTLFNNKRHQKGASMDSKLSLQPLPKLAKEPSIFSQSNKTHNQDYTDAANKGKTKKISHPNWNPLKTKRLALPEEEEEEEEEQNEEEEQEESDAKAEYEAELITHQDPDKIATDLFARLIHPHKPKTFFGKYWLKQPLHIKRKDRTYYEEDNWFSTDELDRILMQEQLRFGTNIDVTTYKDGKRETHNPSGRAYPALVWDKYQQGCSVRLLNPQTYCEETWRLLSTLQEYFGSMVGANVYLTPPGTQGFAPHYDDIEAFVLQLEGKKHWKVYGPRTDSDIWPLVSSKNMTQEELGKPILDCVLEQGDLLYFPRGAIHQAMAQDDEHSLHMTVSTHQRNTWGDLIEKMLGPALGNAMENDPDFRESLPNDYLNYTGIAFQEQEYNGRRQIFMEKLQTLMSKLASYAPVDDACDVMGKKFIQDTLPPHLCLEEKACSINSQGEKWLDGAVRDVVELHPETKVRLIRKHSLRVVNEDRREAREHDEEHGIVKAEAPKKDNEEEEGENAIMIYYNTDNARVYHGADMQYFEIDGDLAPAVEFLQLSYPNFVAIEDLPIEELTDKLDVAMILYDRGLLVTEQLLEILDASDYDDEDDGQDVESLNQE